MTKLKNNSLSEICFFFTCLVYFFLRPCFTILQEVYGFPDVNFAILGAPILLIGLTFLFLEAKTKSFKLNYKNEFSVILFTVILLCLFYTIITQVFSFIDLFKSSWASFGDFAKVAASTMYGYIALFLGGLILVKLLFKKYFFSTLLILWITLTCLVIYTGLFTEGGIFLHGLYSYLSVSDSYAIFTLLILFSISPRKIKHKEIVMVLIIFFCSYCLFTLVSRTSFYFFVAASLMVLMMRGKNVFYSAVIILFLILFLVPFVQKYFWVDTSKWLSYDRMFRILDGLGSDNSFNERLLYNEIGLYTIQNNWLFGDFMGEYLINMKGKYMHNYLSFLRQFGIFPFVLLLIAIFLMLGRQIILLIRKNRFFPIETRVAFFAVIVFVLLEIALSRAYWYPYIFFILGLSIGYDKIINSRDVKDEFTI